MAKRGQNEGSIFQRQDGRWVAVLDLGSKDGHRNRRSFYGATRREVQEKLTGVLGDIQKGLPVLSDKQTVAQYLDSWLKTVVERNVRPSTYASYEHLVRLHIAPALGATPLSKLSTQQVRAFLNAKQDSGLSTRAVQYLHAVLRGALNVAVSDQALIRNVAALVDPPRVVSKEVQPLTPDEARQLLEAVQGDHLEALLVSAVSLGLRQGEALGLRWRDVDLEASKLQVRFALQRHQPKGGGHLEIHLVEPKTRKSRRTIGLPQVTSSALAAHRMRQDEARTLAGTPVDGADGSLRRTPGAGPGLRVHHHYRDAARRP